MNGTHREVKSTSTPSAGEARGIKRTADDSLDDDQRFAKRFNLLNIDNNGKLYVPTPTPTPTPTPCAPAAVPAATAASDEPMHLDDTPTRIYIPSLAAELSALEEASSSPGLIFIPDIERHLSKIPVHILQARQQRTHEGASLSLSPTPTTTTEGQELVLYSVPKSLTVPEERDSVRKAIVEARQRAREKAAVEQEDGGVGEGPPETAHGFDGADYAVEHGGGADPDAMDIG